MAFPDSVVFPKIWAFFDFEYKSMSSNLLAPLVPESKSRALVLLVFHSFIARYHKPEYYERIMQFENLSPPLLSFRYLLWIAYWVSSYSYNFLCFPIMNSL